MLIEDEEILSTGNFHTTALALALLDCMTEQKADFTLTFRRLSGLDPPRPTGTPGPRELFEEPGAFDAWAKTWRDRVAAEGRDPAARRKAMLAFNPAFIPRNHRVQQAIEAAEAGDLSRFDDLLAVLAAWGPCDEDCPEDLNDDDDVDFDDLLLVLAGWGPCD